jgi:hypothetical protein
MKIKRLKLIQYFLIAIVLLIPGSCEKKYSDDYWNDSGNNIEGSEDESDYVWDESDVNEIILNGRSVIEDSEGVVVSGTIIKIILAGTYRFSGVLNDGQIIVNTSDEKIVRLLLNGVSITCSNSSPVFIKKAAKVLVDLADSTENYLEDGSSYVLDNEGEPGATVFSKSYLSFSGNGKLSISANYQDGIVSKDGLVIKNGILDVRAIDDGIRGKDYLIIKDGRLNIESGGDGIKSDNDINSGYGKIIIESGNIIINASGDGITAQNNISVLSGTLNITTGGGAGNSTGSGTTSMGGRPGGTSGGYSGTTSAKGIKSTGSITIDNGTFMVNSADDALHTDGTFTLNGGTLTMATGDDAIHAEGSVTINGDTLIITKSYEGIESPSITVNKGYISLVSTDDGFNATKGNATEANDGSSLVINGGYVVVNSSAGDGIDSNGNVIITGGIIIVHGPQSQPEVGFDINGTFNVSGGLLIGTGPNSGNMIEAPGNSSGQYSVKTTISSGISSNTLFHIQDTEGNDLVTFKPFRNQYYIVFSSAQLKSGSTYHIYLGGSSTGVNNNGLFTGGTYSGGTFRKSFTLSGKTTNIQI